ncbi:MAG: winged helix-turn-helix transcriptional regulator [Candidatus Omnitrophica bacterium]|nr:winged helix-turn-helix transcriptional regulator [Candidatus Omnitrophota bacterium]
MKEFMCIAKALADDNRVRTLMFLRGGELCVCQVIEMLQLAPSTVSKHLAILRQAGLIESRKEGRWIYHHLPEERTRLVELALRWVHESLGRDKTTLRDDRELKRVRETCLEELCNHYSNNCREAA